MNADTLPTDRAAPDLAAARRRGAERMEKWRCGLQDPFSPAALEYSKAAIGEGDIEAGQAADDSAPGQGAWEACRFWLAAGLAWGMLALALCLSPFSGKRLQGRRGIALHGELSNRTRHVLETVHAEGPPDFAIVVGVPRTRLGQVKKAWSGVLGPVRFPVVRPVSLGSLLGSFPDACRALLAARTVEITCPVLPRFRERIGILTRIVLGEAGARWWRKFGCAARITYGHTGTADTISLEQAQQASGCVTVHAVHGISGGRNFIGRSDLAIFRCGHDADWHARLGGYGRCEWTPAPRPPWRRGESGLLLMSSLAHPMYLGWKRNGIDEELALLEAVAIAANEIEAQGQRHWMPHPAMDALPAEQKQRLRAQASRLGFTTPPAGTRFADLARAARWIVSTESTVAVELLSEGLLAVLWRSPWSPADCALARYTPAAVDAASLAPTLRASDGEFASMFDETWRTIRPAGVAR